MAWSQEQREAIEARGSDLLVAAAAGSGKTSVLVQRVIERIMDEKNPVDVDHLLVVTFTNAAAGEMRARIAAALSAAFKQRPDSGRLARQLALMNSASVSTIHSFCQNIVRQYFYLLGLDPQFRVAADTEMGLLKSDIISQLFEESYASGREEFLRLTQYYGDERGDGSLHQLVLGLYRFARSHPWPDLWLGGLADRLAVPEGTEMDDTPWSGPVREEILFALERIGQEFEFLAGEAMQSGQPVGYIPALQADRQLIGELMDAARHSWERLACAMSRYEFGGIGNAGKGIAPDVRKRYQDKRNHLKKAVGDIRSKYFERTVAEFFADMRSVAPLVSELARLVQEFAARFQQAKREQGLVDFNDLEHGCLAILRDPSAPPGELEPSPVALALREKYEEVLIDEYQDTNGVQEAILMLTARADRPNRFMVGDVKQSIYRFRLAQPELFLDKYRDYEQDDIAGRRIDLTRNFRSRASVLHAVNFLFSQVMTCRAAELDYGEREKLNPGAEYPPPDGPGLDGAVELHLIDRSYDENGAAPEEAEEPDDPDSGPNSSGADEERELKGFELEARLITRRINALMESRVLIFDKQAGYRPVEWRDIVILLRSVQGKAPVMLDALRQASVPCYAQLDSGYFRETEVQVVLSLLAVIDNPRQDIELAGVLRSPLFGFTAEELAEIRLYNPQGELWDAVTGLAENPQDEPAGTALVAKLQDFIARLSAWRGFARRQGVADLIRRIYRDTGYYDYAGGMPGGVIRQANLRAMHDRARQYEATNFRGLFRFLRFIDRMKDQGSDMSVARALGESENVVRIMSIHKSKGLEFPVVFVADTGKGMNLEDIRQPILCHKTYGVGPHVIRPEEHYHYPTIARRAIQHKMVMETKAEEMRVLYVAMTRAREKLILVGSANRLADCCGRWSRTADRDGVHLPDALAAAARSYLDWLCPAVARHPDGEALRRYGGCEKQPGNWASSDPSRWSVRIYRREEIVAGEETSGAEDPILAKVEAFQPLEPDAGSEWVDTVLDWQYPYSAAVGKPAKLSVSEIKRRFDPEDDNGGQPLYSPPPALRPAFLQSEGRLTAAEYGTVMHMVMQHVDIHSDVNPPAIARQLDELVDREVLLAAQSGQVDRAAIVTFWNGPLGRRVRRSGDVRRELPFSRLIPAERFYPELAGAGETVFIQGVIDCLFREPDGWVLIDYKTDRFHDSGAMIAKYRIQLALYAEAVEAILGERVKERWLYLFHTGEAVLAPDTGLSGPAAGGIWRE